MLRERRRTRLALQASDFRINLLQRHVLGILKRSGRAQTRCRCGRPKRAASCVLDSKWRRRCGGLHLQSGQIEGAGRTRQGSLGCRRGKRVVSRKGRVAESTATQRRSRGCGKIVESSSSTTNNATTTTSATQWRRGTRRRRTRHKISKRSHLIARKGIGSRSRSVRHHLHTTSRKRRSRKLRLLHLRLGGWK